MNNGCVYEASTERCLIPQVWQTTNPFERMRGLLARPELNKNQGLWIEPCPSVHTIGMRYPIDVIFMDKAGTIKTISHGLKPLRFSSCPGARSTLELRSGVAKAIGMQEGMNLIYKIEESQI